MCENVACLARPSCYHDERFVNLDACGCYYDRSGCYHDGIVSPKEIPLFLQRAAFVSLLQLVPAKPISIVRLLGPDSWMLSDSEDITMRR